MRAGQGFDEKFLLRGHGRVGRQPGRHPRPEQLREPGGVRARREPAIRRAWPGTDPQFLGERAAAPDGEERIQIHTSLPGDLRRMREHFQLGGQSEPAESHAGGRTGLGQQRRRGREAAQTRGQQSQPRLEKPRLPGALSFQSNSVTGTRTSV